MKKFELTDSDLEKINDSLDETGGMLIKDSELKHWIEHYVNEDRKARDHKKAREDRLMWLFMSLGILSLGTVMMIRDRQADGFLIIWMCLSALYIVSFVIGKFRKRKAA